MGLVHKKYEEKKAQLSTILIERLDEWTSIPMKRSINSNLHDAKEKEPFNLGLVRIFRTCSAIRLSCSSENFF